ncbi:MAG: DUF1924 domain-containing protein [Burkholderiales bacterium]|nr:DUF1924 domain-containing protein [Burkholderiales bacterium]MDE2452597.1 DUF1924 domain-containing protein [Burkholderiales bacterium]
MNAAIASPLLALLLTLNTGAASAAADTTPGEILSSLTARAGVAPSAQRGRQFFVSRHGREWSCSTCHGELPTTPGRHAATGKSIAPLAPAFDAARFGNAAKTEKWFRRNCNDVVGRECSAAEKADVLGWLMSLQR